MFPISSRLTVRESSLVLQPVNIATCGPSFSYPLDNVQLEKYFQVS